MKWVRVLFLQCTMYNASVAYNGSTDGKVTANGLHYNVVRFANASLCTGAEITPEPWQLSL